MVRTLQTVRGLMIPFIVALTLTSVPAGAITPMIQSDWKGLPVETREILAPLEKEWALMEPFRRQKWLGIADRYPKMSGEEQARVQTQMLDWARLTPEQRAAAREKFKTLKNAPPEHKEAVKQKWEEYKSLPEEEKQRLKEQAQQKPQAPKPVASGAASLKPLTQPVVPIAKPPQPATDQPLVPLPSTQPASTPAAPK